MNAPNVITEENGQNPAKFNEGEINAVVNNLTFYRKSNKARRSQVHIGLYA